MTDKDKLIAVITAGQAFIEKMRELNPKDEDIEVVEDLVGLYEDLRDFDPNLQPPWV